MVQLISEKIIKSADNQDKDSGRFQVIKLVNKFVRTLKITYMSYYGTHKYSSVNRMIKDSAEFISTKVLNENKDNYTVEIYRVKDGGRKFIQVYFKEDGETGDIIATTADGKTISSRELDYNGAQQVVGDIIDLFDD